MRITTWNVHFGKNIEAISRAFTKNPNLSGSDVVLLQEIESYPEEGTARAEKIAEQLGYRCVYAPARTKRRGSHGIALLSRFPIESAEIVELPFFDSPVRPRRRIALVVKVSTPDGPVHVCNVHLDVRINAQQRIEQLRSLVERMKTLSPDPVIITGDFNTSPFHFAFRLFPVLPVSQRRRVERYMVQSGFSGIRRLPLTYRPAVIPMRLDHIYASGVRMERSGVEKRVRVSDHRPVWADLAFA